MMTWREGIAEALSYNGETWDDIIFCTLSQSELDESFDDDYGGTEGKPFGVWTSNYVYFPTEYDGAEDVASVPRHPRPEPIHHI